MFAAWGTSGLTAPMYVLHLPKVTCIVITWWMPDAKLSSRLWNNVIFWESSLDSLSAFWSKRAHSYFLLNSVAHPCNCLQLVASETPAFVEQLNWCQHYHDNLRNQVVEAVANERRDSITGSRLQIKGAECGRRERCIQPPNHYTIQGTQGGKWRSQALRKTITYGTPMVQINDSDKLSSIDRHFVLKGD